MFAQLHQSVQYTRPLSFGVSSPELLPEAVHSGGVLLMMGKDEEYSY